MSVKSLNKNRNARSSIASNKGGQGLLSREAKKIAKRNLEIYEEKLEMRIIPRIRIRIFNYFWDNDFQHYNTVAETINEKYFPFWALQIYRFLAFLTMFQYLFRFFYIYVKQTLMYYHFYLLLLASFAFFFLWTGGGK